MTGGDWRNSVVSDDGTHHVVDGAPLYAARFTEVLKFHAPGLAPVLDGSGAYHVDTAGRPAYAARLRRTFGFYEGVAAVVAEDGWLHLRPDGTALSAGRWAWAGNFQGGRCPVRDGSGRYRHIGADGRPAYEAGYRYAGDYRDGIAVVQRDDGYSTHIDASGDELHGHWFVDLDVFHKGFSRARDEAGWMHVDRHGHPVHGRRFAAVEPFYNGQARVERDDGGLEVIDEAGRTVVELRPARRDLLHSVSAELVSFWRCQAIFAAVDAGLFERLPLGDDALNEPERRLLGALGELGLVTRDGDRWAVSLAGALLRGEHPQSLRAAAHYWASVGRRDWSALPRAVADPAWRAPNPFAEAAADPASVRALHAALAPYAAHDYAGVGAVIDPGHNVIDAGGGSGALSVALLRAWPDARGVVLDRPEVAAQGTVPDDLSGRLRFVGGDLFSPWPVNGDAVVLARVLHDWPDERAIEVLRRAREAVDAGGRLYVVELVRPETGFRGGLLSLHLLLSTGGRERTAAQFHELLRRSGWEYEEVRRLSAVVDVVVARAA
ncbi:MAG: methyltransferase [Deltaproteobacteria bacterium]|nr:methyltransferase [Deltaproteobacteria bacterium]